MTGKKDHYLTSVNYKNDLADLSKLLVQIRGSKRLSMRDLSVLSGVQAYHICNIENMKTKTTVTTVSKLFNAMGYSISDAYRLLPDNSNVVD